MTPEAQRIAIAKACGWTHFQPDTIQYTARRADGKWGELPDYLNDLNAMHEAEVWLKNDDAHAFACYASDFFEEHGSDAIHLSAAQRAEAFLKTLNLWTDDT